MARVAYRGDIISSAYASMRNSSFGGRRGAWYWYNNNVQAHSTKQIAETAAREGLPVAPMKPSDAREILTRSCKIAEVLHRVVNGKSFSFDDSRGMHRENAESLWTGCRFNIAR